MSCHGASFSAMLQAGILQEEVVNFKTESSCRAMIVLWLSRPEVLPVRRGCQHNTGFQNTRHIVESFSSLSYLLSSAATACLRPVCECVLAWRVGMLSCHTAWSWSAYTVSLFRAWLFLAQWPVDFS